MVIFSSSEHALATLRVLLIFTPFIITGFIIGKIRNKKEAQRQAQLNERTSLEGIVVKKEYADIRGYYFFVYAEHQLTAEDGSTTVITKDYEVDPKTYEQIEIGCKIVADKNFEEFTF